ncbi:MAG: site-specific integrase [Bryobacteraceae bacterium]
MKAPKLGPIGKGWVAEVKTQDGARFVARWNAYEIQNGRRVRVIRGPYEIGPKSSHGPGLRDIKQARLQWKKICWQVFAESYSPVALSRAAQNATREASNGFPEMKVKDFISLVYEKRRKEGLEENSRINWEYYRDSFLVSFFGDYSISEMNDEDLIRRFMEEIADRKFSLWTAKKAFTYTKAILDTARDLGVIQGNASRLIPKTQRVPKRIKKPQSQPSISIDQFIALSEEIKTPRDRLILNILFLCAVRRGELFTLKWKDFHEQNGMYVLDIQRSFCSRTHKIKEWAGKIAGEGKAAQKVAVPPQLAKDILGWREYGLTNGSDPESYIFPTRNSTPIIATNWAEDILKPAGERIGLPGVSYHWFRRGYATVQHHQHVADKPIQGQLRHSKAETTREIYMQQIDTETFQAVCELEKRIRGTRLRAVETKRTKIRKPA